MLDRDPDANGLRIRAGQYAEVVLALLQSPEFERRLAGAR